MKVYVMLDVSGFVMGVYKDKKLAIQRLHMAWDSYQIIQVYDCLEETKFCIRQRTKIGENPNDTLIVTTVRITTQLIIEGQG